MERRRTVQPKPACPFFIAMKKKKGSGVSALPDRIVRLVAWLNEQRAKARYI